MSEKLEIREEYYNLSESILQSVLDCGKLPKSKLIVSVCGESGSGKTVTATCLVKKLLEYGINAVVLNQDGFYFLTPKENSERRKSDVNWVGPQEVNLKLIQDSLNQFKKGASNLKIRIVDYKKNNIFEKDLDVVGVQVIVVEGTYSFLLEGLDYKIFLERTFRDTEIVRRSRSREQYDPFVEEVLQIEHEIISKFKRKADMLISKDYTLQVNQE